MLILIDKIGARMLEGACVWYWRRIWSKHDISWKQLMISFWILIITPGEYIGTMPRAHLTHRNGKSPCSDVTPSTIPFNLVQKNTCYRPHASKLFSLWKFVTKSCKIIKIIYYHDQVKSPWKRNSSFYSKLFFDKILFDDTPIWMLRNYWMTVFEMNRSVLFRFAHLFIFTQCTNVINAFVMLIMNC